MNPHPLEQELERHFSAGASAINDPAALESFLALRDALERGELRSASPDSSATTGWRVNAWVKKGILLGFRIGVLQDFPAGTLSFVDKHTYPVRHFSANDGIRVVMGGS
jgi:2,3,4,5-tetrahydropyridine-2-carboxylate N-succinyltransferase